MKSLLREPLFYFLLLGAVLFGAYQFASSGDMDEEPQGEIVISDGQIDALIQGFERVWQRLPTQQELDNLVQGYIREEIMYREALAMGLDRDDQIIRRRLQQKLEFLTDDIASLAEPTTEELEAFRLENAALYRKPSRFSLQHIYFNVNERRESAVADAVAVLESLQQQGDAESELDPSTLGDQLLMTPLQFELADENEIAREMGQQFVNTIKELPIGDWQGPVDSGFGIHLVRISQHIEGDLPPLAEIQAAVQRDWEAEQREQVNESFYLALREQYRVTFADPEATATQVEN